ncbi:cytochrome b/b6 domain-containing protein [Vibrio makurazakiensis]|uniref:cytochrome b/b6 domain-containing protein n=1 Tax=Vibrio makurazakiensis TaxID=2910250 RepID=UPI003D0F5306
MKVWDLATRLYHWLQAIVFIGLLISGFSGNGPHIQLGLVLFTLIVWRILWGFYGSETNRFSQFVRSPIKTFQYLTGRSPQSTVIGHNPAGGWMVILMILGLLLQCITGLALAGLLDNLPLAHYWLSDTTFEVLETLHIILSKALPALVVIHIGAILTYKLNNKPLLKAMFTGIQNAYTNTGTQQPNFVSQRVALLVLVVSGLVTIAIVALSMV